MAQAIKEIWGYRYFWLSLVQADLATQYRRSVLGMMWSLLQPIVMTVVICVVFSTLFQLDLRFYGPFLLVGFTFWRYFSTCLVGAAGCLYAAEPFMRQHPAPVAMYPLRHTLAAGFHFLLGMVLAIVATCILNGVPGPMAVPALIVGLILLFVLGWAMATLSGFLNIYMPDGAHLLDILVQVLFYMTPIIYPPEMLRERGMGWFIDYNPIGALLDLVRAPLMTGQPATMWAYTYSLICVTIVSLIALMVLKRCERRILYIM